MGLLDAVTDGEADGPEESTSVVILDVTVGEADGPEESTSVELLDVTVGEADGTEEELEPAAPGVSPSVPLFSPKTDATRTREMLPFPLGIVVAFEATERLISRKVRD